MAKPLVFCVVGTRPEAVKMAPVVAELRRFPDLVETRLVSTGQHREILHETLAVFGLKADVDLDILQQGASLAQVTCRALEGIDGLLESQNPAMVLAQGDTTTVFAAALASFYRRIPFGHVEAGLRTPQIDNPFPEEFNRRAAGLVADLHLAPTTWARDNLLAERKDPSTVFVTGNTGIDAVLHAAEVGQEAWFPEHSGRVVLLTTHRRENWGEKQAGIARAALALVEEFPDVLLVVPMHPNPAVRETLRGVLEGHPRVALTEPPEYGRFVKLLQRSHLILSDSGGVQEEAPAFGVPVLVLRDTTERPEGCDAGTAKLVGTEEATVREEARRLLADEAAYRTMAKAVSPYGDGKASARTRFLVLGHLGVASPEVPMWA